MRAQRRAAVEPAPTCVLALSSSARRSSSCGSAASSAGHSHAMHSSASTMPVTRCVSRGSRRQAGTGCSVLTAAAAAAAAAWCATHIAWR